MILLPSEADLWFDSAEERGRLPRKHRTRDNMNRTGPAKFLIGDNILRDVVVVDSRQRRSFVESGHGEMIVSVGMKKEEALLVGFG